MSQVLIQNSVVGISPLIGDDHLGCFAPCAFKKDDIIEECLYHTLSADHVEALCDSILEDYWFINPENEKERHILLGNGPNYNHSSNPNISFHIEEGVYVFFALRDIEENEELCFDYGPDYDYEGNGFTR